MDAGRLLIIAGLVILAAGLAVTFGGRVPLLGRLPGDFTFQGDRWTLYAPLATTIIISLAFTVALNLFAWLARR